MKRILLATLSLPFLFCLAQEEVYVVNPAFKVTGDNGLSPTVQENIHTGNNEMFVNLEGHVCVDNTTTNALGSGGVFTGLWQDALNYGVVSIQVLTDEDSATDGLRIQWSPDKVSISGEDVFSIFGNIGKTFTFGPAARYVRLVYTNGATQQTSFFLTTILRRVYVKPSSHRITDLVVGEDDAELVKSIGTGQKPNGEFVNFRATAGGNPTVSLQEYDEAFLSNPLPTAIYGTEYLSGMSGIDASTEAQYVVDYAHHETHEGDHYFYCENVTLGSGAIRNILINVANSNKWPHMVWTIRSSGEANMVLYEETTTSSDGTAVNERNHNRNSIKTSITQVFHTPTITADGTQICTEHFGSGQNAGGASRGETEIILKQNTKYLLRVTSEAAANDITTRLNWYEHSDKN